jgi:hypothetical protein
MKDLRRGPPTRAVPVCNEIERGGGDLHEIELARWDDFERETRTLHTRYAEPGALLFRGLTDADWRLTTTLERHEPEETLFEAYYRIASASEPQIRSFTDSLWDTIETYPEMRSICAAGFSDLDRHLSFGGMRAFGYLAYLRHFAFPSPLLDWTRSSAIAAFFAYRGPTPPASGRVAIFAYCEQPDGMKLWGSGEPRIYRMGT